MGSFETGSNHLKSKRIMNLALSITTIKMITQNGVDLKNDFQSFRVTGVLNTPMPHSSPRPEGDPDVVEDYIFDK
jgi:hypothetical protein